MITKESAILLTGAAGFIGSYLLGYLNKLGFHKIIIVDDFDDEDKWFNFDGKEYVQQVDRELLFDWLVTDNVSLSCILHLGARTDTTEFDFDVLEKWNIEYSKKIWRYCTHKKIPLIYASSAATYGAGEFGYTDDHQIVEKLQPLNPYGISKNEFDKWVLQQADTPRHWYGLKFFNVYGPNEYHKERMASMVFHGFNQASRAGKVKLFRSHNPKYSDGAQLRDFIYVEDVVAVIFWIMQNEPKAGLYNVGTGKARTFNDLIAAVFSSLQKPVAIEYIDTPADIRDKYQYYTEADMGKLYKAGYTSKFGELEDGVDDYVKNFLLTRSYF